jgi:hypothetical protein
MTDAKRQIAGAAECEYLAARKDGFSNFLLRPQQTYTYSGGADDRRDHGKTI